MPLISLIENLNVIFKCVLPNRTKAVEEKIRKDTQQIESIVILHIKDNIDLDNIFPITNHVALWNSFVVGKNFEYVLVSVNDELKDMIVKDKLLNNTGENILPKDLNDFFEYLWKTTINDGINLQLYMLYANSVYLVNTYSLKNAKNVIIGAVAFMRMVKNMPIAKTKEIRVSAELEQLTTEKKNAIIYDKLRRQHSN